MRPENSNMDPPILKTSTKKWHKIVAKQTVDMERAWGLSQLKLHMCTRHTIIVMGYQGSRPIAVKFFFNIQDLENEQTALAFFQDVGPAILAVNFEYRCLLMEQITRDRQRERSNYRVRACGR